MSPDERLVVIFGALHLVALLLGIVLFVMFVRSGRDSDHRPPEDEEGGGGGNDRLPDRPPTTSPRGGIPLPDAEPAGIRLRSHQKLRDAHPRPLRRGPAEPARPARRRVPG